MSDTTKISRAVGVLIAYEKHNGGNKPKNAAQLIRTEYNNYLENCYYCNEEPMDFKMWSSEIIKPAKN